MNCVRPKRPRLRPDATLYEQLRHQVLRRDGWRCQVCGSMSGLIPCLRNRAMRHDGWRCKACGGMTNLEVTTADSLTASSNTSSPLC